MSFNPRKIICEECTWIGETWQLLRAKNPFAQNEEITGCPGCKSIDCFLRLCDEPGCKNRVSSGFPTPSEV